MDKPKEFEDTDIYIEDEFAYKNNRNIIPK